jgi:hypothetical protein
MRGTLICGGTYQSHFIYSLPETLEIPLPGSKLLKEYRGIPTSFHRIEKFSRKIPIAPDSEKIPDPQIH